jgi:hypothetical protein
VFVYCSTTKNGSENCLQRSPKMEDGKKCQVKLLTMCNAFLFEPIHSVRKNLFELKN